MPFTDTGVEIDGRNEMVGTVAKRVAVGCSNLPAVRGVVRPGRNSAIPT